MKLALLPTKNSLSPTLRKRMIGLLNQQLADVLDLGWQARQAHWNVKGPAFISLHELFGTVADDLDNHADELAERSVQLGGLALGTLQAVVNSSRLPAYPVTLTAGRKHLTAL
ncbi:MAG TPA: DNA starvation/stationary phase protection protein Dps, partial [Verrucomicrobiae bacterium]